MRIARTLVRVLALVLVLLVGLTAAAAAASQTPWFRNWLRGYVVTQAERYINGRLSIERLDGNLFFGLELRNVAITIDGETVVAARDLSLSYNVFQLIARGLSLNEIRLDGPVLHMRRAGDAWSLGTLVKKQEQEADREGPASPIAIDAIILSEGSVIFDDPLEITGVTVPRRIEQLNARLSFNYEPVRYSVSIASLSGRATDPAFGLNALSGAIAVKDDTVFIERLALRTDETSLAVDGTVQNYLTTPILKLRLSSDKVSLPEIARLVPSLAGVPLLPAFELGLDGSLEGLGISANLRSSAGQAVGTLTVDLLEPAQAASGHLSVAHLDIGSILDDPKQTSDITADVTFDLKGRSFSDPDSLSGTAAIVAPRITAAGYTAESISGNATIAGRRVALVARAQAYGASATASGDVGVPVKGDPLTFNLKGRLQHVNLRRLPRLPGVPSADTDVSADYRVAGTEPIAAATDSPRSRRAGPAAARRVAGELRFANSSLPGARIAAGSVAGFDVRGPRIGYRANATITDVDLQRLGNAFAVPALAADRYKSRFTLRINADGAGTDVKTLSLRANGAIIDASLLGGRVPQLTFDGTMDGDVLHVKAVGDFTEFDPAVASGKPAMQGTTGGSFDVDASVNGVSSGVTLDNVTATAQLTLGASTVGGLAINEAHLDADYEHQTADVRRLEVVGRDMNLEATGTLALGDSGQSNLAFHADSPSLEEIGAIFETPLTGMGKVDGTITGNRRELQAKGSLVADGVTYQGNGALTASSSFDARVPDLEWARAVVEAETQATFVTIAGQNINELEAKTAYEDRHLRFDVVARQPQRSLDAAGSLALHPEHQEIHLERLALRATNQEWLVPAGVVPTINYGRDTLSVENLHLVSGDQEIVANGQWGRPGDTLTVSLNNIDIANVEALLLRPPQFTGRLNGSGSVEGTRSAPEVTGEFQVANGGFRDFKYETLHGTLEYAGAGVTIDARLEQNATQWIAAKGYVPTALFTAAGDGTERLHVESSSGADRIDLTIESSPLDLGLVQGFTTSITNVKGTLEAHVRVTGSAGDPHPSGSIAVANGSLTVEPTGVSYTNIAGRVDLEPDRVHIDNIVVLDNQQSSLSLSGDLAVHAGTIGGFQLWITAEDFKILDNKLGNVRIQSAMELAGELRAPVIRGDLGVTTGRVDLDEMIALAGPSAYATEAIEYGDSAKEPKPAAEPSMMDALQMNLRLTVPNDLVVKAQRLQAPGATVPLGALNLTIGGDLTASKERNESVRLTGSVSTVRGTYDFQGRRFEILREGSVLFDGADASSLNPRLDVRARRLIQGVEALVTVRGTLQEPEIRLSSTPPLEEADILSLIVFNQPINQIGEGAQISLAQRAQGLAADAVTGQVAQSIGHALNLDTFEIQLAPEDGGSPQVTLGQQVGQNLFVKVQQGIGDQSTTNFTLEYELATWLRLQTNFVQGSETQASLFRRRQGSGADLIVLFSR